MKARRILSDIEVSLKGWYRNKARLFWTLAFPTLLILIFGAIFSGEGENYTLYICNEDNTPVSEALIENLSHVMEIKMVDGDIEKYALDHPVLLIPQGFGESVMKKKKCNLSLYINPTDAVVRTIIMGFVNKMNLLLSGGEEIVGYEEKSVAGEKYEYIDFFIPGIIGMTIMTSAIYGSIEINVKYRKKGILKKLLTTPITRGEWIFSKMVFQLILAFISTFIIIGVGKIAFSTRVMVSWLSVLIIIASSFAFTGVGMIISRFVNEEETADSAASAIIFPMMFLAGTFFPLEMMPPFLQKFARVLPLYYVNEGLRNSMILDEFGKAIWNAAIVFTFAIIFFVVGSLITSWRED